MLDFNVLNAGYQSVLAGSTAEPTCDPCSCGCSSECSASCDCDLDCPCSTCESRGQTDSDATALLAIDNYLGPYKVSRDGANDLLGLTVACRQAGITP